MVSQLLDLPTNAPALNMYMKGPWMFSLQPHSSSIICEFWMGTKPRHTRTQNWLTKAMLEARRMVEWRLNCSSPNTFNHFKECWELLQYTYTKFINPDPNHHCRVRFPTSSQHGQNMALIQLIRLTLTKIQLCPILQIRQISPHRLIMKISDCDLMFLPSMAMCVIDGLPSMT